MINAGKLRKESSQWHFGFGSSCRQQQSSTSFGAWWAFNTRQSVCLWTAIFSCSGVSDKAQFRAIFSVTFGDKFAFYCFGQAFDKNAAVRMQIGFNRQHLGRGAVGPTGHHTVGGVVARLMCSPSSLLNLGAGDALHRSHPFLKEVWSNG